MQRIGIEIGDSLRPRRSGMARYAESLFAALRRLDTAADISGWASWRRVLGGLVKPANGPVRYFRKTAPRDIPDVFHATACVFPQWKSKIEIATVHDLYGVPPLERMPPDTRRRIGYIERADRIVCVSQFTREHLHRLLGISHDRTVAIPLAAASHFVCATAEARGELRARLRLPREFLLFVGRDRPNKNLDRLIAAYARSRLQLPLCIAGRHSVATTKRLRRLAADENCNGSLRWLGEVRDVDLPTLLSCASAVCMPSTFEGFGLPVIEALACGAAVLTSRNCATEEAAGGFATLIEPESIDSIADGLTTVLQTPEAQRAAARTYAASRTWNDVARETWRVYVEAVSSR